MDGKLIEKLVPAELRNSYTFTRDGIVTSPGKFEGDDFGASPLHEPESLESAKALLGFLTVRKGDVDEEYFKNYTPAQIAFRDSFDCESLQLYTLDE